MQTRDEVTDNITPKYTDRTLASDLPRPTSASVRMVAVVAAWLVPGAGHLALGRYGRALLFFVVLVGSFIFGLSIEGRLYWPMATDSSSGLRFDLITVLWFFAQIGSGLCYVVSYTLGLGLNANPQAPSFEYGTALMCLVGLLNYLVVHDVFDIAAGRKR